MPAKLKITLNFWEKLWILDENVYKTVKSSIKLILLHRFPWNFCGTGTKYAEYDELWIFFLSKKHYVYAKSIVTRYVFTSARKPRISRHLSKKYFWYSKWRSKRSIKNIDIDFHINFRFWYNFRRLLQNHIIFRSIFFYDGILPSEKRKNAHS